MVNQCSDYPASEDEDEEAEDDAVGENRDKTKKKRDIDYKGDWREFSNRITSLINDPEFEVITVVRHPVIGSRVKIFDF